MTAAILALLVGSLTAVLLARRPYERTFFGALHDVLPKGEEIPGWRVEHLPIANTASMLEATLRILDYDDAIFAVYTSGDLRVSVFGAYWMPDKVSTRLVAGHTPDVCWVAQGWQIWQGDTRRVNVLNVPGGAARTLEVEHRVYARRGQVEHLIFHHEAGGRRRPNGGVGSPPWHSTFSDLWASGFRQREEQFFWRISSNQPLSVFERAAPVQSLIAFILNRRTMSVRKAPTMP